MLKKIASIFLFLIFLIVYNCKAPSTVVEEGAVRKGMSREEMKKAFRFTMLGAHNPFKDECFHEYYPLKKMEIISGKAKVLTEIDSGVESVFYILGNVTIPSHKGKLSRNECSHGNGTLEAWVKGHYEALDYVSQK